MKPSPLHPETGRSAPCAANEGHGGSPVCGGNSSVPLESRELFTVRRGPLSDRLVFFMLTRLDNPALPVLPSSGRKVLIAVFR